MKRISLTRGTFCAAIAVVWTLAGSAAIAAPAKAGANDRGLAPPGRIDDEILKYILEENRLNFLAGKTHLVGVTLPPDKAGGFANSFAVGDFAGRVAMGSEKREAFIAKAPGMLQKRRQEVVSTFGDKLADVQKLVDSPQYRAEWFLIAVTEGVRQMHLPPEVSKPRMLLGKRLQSLYDEDAQRRGAAPPADRDQAWLDGYIAQSEKALFAALKPEYQKELVKAWPVMFPDGGVKAPEVVIAEGADTKPAPDVMPARKGDEDKTTAVAAKDWVSALRKVDPASAEGGAWELHGSSLFNVQVPRKHDVAKIALVSAPTGSFELRLTFNRRKGEKEFAVLFPVAGRPAQLWMGGMAGQSSSIEGGSDSSASKARIINGKDQKLDMNVLISGDSADIKVTLDGTPYIAWKGPISKMNQRYKLADDKGLGLAVHPAAVVEFKDVQFRDLGAQGDKK